MMERKIATLDRSHPGAIAASVIMALSAILRMWYYLSAPVDGFILSVRVALPVSAAVLLIAGNFLGGKRFCVPSCTAVALGVVFFIIKAAVDFDPLHQGLCTLLYITVLTVYTLAVTGIIPTTKLLFPLFGLPLAYHIIVEDTRFYFFADPPVPLWDWIPEISVLCIMAALLCQAFAMGTSRSGNGE